MATFYKLQAVDSVTGASHFWTSATADDSDFPGANDAEELTVLAEHGLIDPSETTFPNADSELTLKVAAETATKNTGLADGGTLTYEYTIPEADANKHHSLTFYTLVEKTGGDGWLYVHVVHAQGQGVGFSTRRYFASATDESKFDSTPPDVTFTGTSALGKIALAITNDDGGALSIKTMPHVVAIKSDSPTTPTGTITAITYSSGGGSVPDGAYSDEPVLYTDGTGTGATVSTTVLGEGYDDHVLEDGGDGYAVGDIIRTHHASDSSLYFEYVVESITQV